jgi:hypothetical protein
MLLIEVPEDLLLIDSRDSMATIEYLWRLCRLYETLHLIKTNVPSLSLTLFTQMSRQLAQQLLIASKPDLLPINATYRICVHFPRYSTHVTSLVDSLTQEIHPWFWSLTLLSKDTWRPPSYRVFFTKFDPLFTGKIRIIIP